LLTALICTK